MARPIIGGKIRSPRAGLSVSRDGSRKVAHLAAGVCRLVVDEGGIGQRLDNYLFRHLKGVPRTHVYRVIRSGEVRVNRGRAAADLRLAAGDVVRVPPMRLPDRERGPESAPVPPRAFPVLYEDDWLLAIDKPAGVAVHGGSGISYGVIEQLRRARPDARFLELVHRLDKETSGILLLAKKRSALTALQRQLRQRGAEKHYTALVIGTWPAAMRVIDIALHKYVDATGERRVKTVDADHVRARRSVTLVEVAQCFDGFTLLDVAIKTGRTHQIRVHLAQAGHPIVGDAKYGEFGLNRAMARGGLLPGVRFERMFLHARRLAFDHPGLGERLTLQAPLPVECATLLQQLPPQL